MQYFQQLRKIAMSSPAPHPFFRPLYRRLLVMVACVAWLAFELVQQDPLWLALAVGATGYGAWDFFLSGNYGGKGDGGR
jgi:hypothetical protein